MKKQLEITYQKQTWEGYNRRVDSLPGKWQQLLKINVCIPPQDTSGLDPCNHEELDTRMFVHLADAVTKGFNKVLLNTVDTDVVVLTVAAAASINVQELWVAFGTAKSWHIPVHDITRSLGPSKSIALPMFYAYTGCDMVSLFGKRERRHHGSLG